MMAEHIMRLHWREVVSYTHCASHNKQKTQVLMCLMFYIYFIHLSASITLPPSHRGSPICRHSFGIMLHVQANCAAKGIISVHCRRPVNQSCLCGCHNALLSSHPGRLTQCPLTVCLQGRDLCAALALVALSSRGGLCLTLAFQAASNTVCGET